MTMRSPSGLSWDRFVPPISLMVLAPLVSEVLFGATRLSIFYPTLLLEVGVYGGAALLIRELARRRGLGWPAIFLLGVAFGLIEECVMLQTSVSPFFFRKAPAEIYGWAFGVNWVYLLWAVVFESAWCIALPIQLVELLFPVRRETPWLGRPGLLIASLVFVLASVAVWYRWSFIVALALTPDHRPYQAPVLEQGIALVAAVVLVLIGLGLRRSAHPTEERSRRAPRPWLLGLFIFVPAVLWFVLPILVFVATSSLSMVPTLLIGIVLIGGVAALVRRWAGGEGWRDAHRLALISGALLASMLTGYLVNGVLMSVPDLITKLVLNVLALVALIVMAWRLRRESRGSAAVL